jgi:solute:Na+ symporter, SSS family
VEALDYAVIVLYFAVMLGAAYWGFRRAKTADDYLVAGRRLGYPMFIGCMAAVVLGGASTIGTVSLGYQYGLSGMWLVVMLGLGLIVLGVVISGRLAQLRVYTVPELIARRYGISQELMSALVMAAYALMVAVTSTVAIGTVFDVALDVSSTVAILLAGGIVVVYCVAGGMWSITLTDIIQFCVMTVGIFCLLLPFAIDKAGGWGEMRDALPGSYFDLDSIGTETIGTYFLLYFLGIMIGQDIWQRVFTGRDARVTSRGTAIAGAYCLLYGIAGALVGAAAKVVLPDLDAPDNAFAEVVVEALPVGVAGLVLAAALAAVMSTASATLLASATVLANDVYPRVREVRDQVMASRVATLLVGMVVIALALILDNVVGALTVAYDLLTGALFVPIIGALFWSRATPAAATASIAVGTVTVIVLMIVRGLYSNSPIIFGLLASLVVFVAVSLARPAEPAASPRATAG